MKEITQAKAIDQTVLGWRHMRWSSVLSVGVRGAAAAAGEQLVQHVDGDADPRECRRVEAVECGREHGDAGAADVLEGVAAGGVSETRLARASSGVGGALHPAGRLEALHLAS